MAREQGCQVSGNAIRKAIPVVLFLCALGYVVFRSLGCKPPEPGTLPAYCTDDKLYTAALLRCVDKSETLAQSQQCRASVDYSCGIIQTITVTK
jgi:hypothetical protein